MIRQLSIGIVATLAVATTLALTFTSPAKATEKLTLSHVSMDRVMKMKRGSKKSGATKLTSGRAKAATGDGKYIIRKFPGRAK